MKKIYFVFAGTLAVTLGMASITNFNKEVTPIFASDESIVLQGEGTQEDPYLITNDIEMEYVIDQVYTFNSQTSVGNDYSGEYLKLTNDVSVTLSGYNITSHTFRGTLDGDNHTITLSSTSGSQYVAMFGYVGSAGTVRNLIFDGEMTNTTGDYLAPLAIYNTGTVENIVNNATLGNTTVRYVGGIIARSSMSGSNSATTGVISNCINNGDIVGNTYVGGITGQSGGGQIINCTNNGSVTGTSSSIGGIVGLIGVSNTTSNPALVTNCINNGAVTSSNFSGGIVGGGYPGAVISNCKNYGNVSASGGTAGIIGYLNLRVSGTSITNCLNYADITSSNNAGVGGIVGKIVSNTSGLENVNILNIGNCISLGNITTKAGWAGGLLGYATGSHQGIIYISNSISAANVIDTSTTGTLGGFMIGQNGSIIQFILSDCESVASITYSGSGAHDIGLATSITKVSYAEGSKTLSVGGSTKGTVNSSNLFDVIDVVNGFDCDESKASKLVNAYADLTSDELNKLFDITVYYDDDTSNTYAAASEYINNWYNGNVGGLSSVLGLNNFDNKFIVPAIIIITLTSSMCIFFLIRRKRNNK